MKSAFFVSNRNAIATVALLLGVLFGMGTARAESITIDAQQLQQLIAEGVPVVDVRTSEEWRATGVIPDSHLITFFDRRGNYDLPGWLTQLVEIANPQEPVVIICDIGNRSRMISSFLADKVGYSEIYDATGGIREWITLELPTENWP